MSIDTLRADHVGQRDARGDPLTPNLDALAARGLRFTRANAQANESLFSHRSIFMGALGAAMFGLDDLRAGRPSVLPTFVKATGPTPVFDPCGGCVSEVSCD